MEAKVNKILREATRRYYWVGVAVGFLVGMILGGIIGYDLGSDTIHIITLNQGIRT